MALPAPLSLKLKRKHEDAPVDAVYIESEAAASDHGDLAYRYVYKRVKSGDEKVEQNPIRQPTDANGIPIVLPTTSDDPATLSAQLETFKFNDVNKVHTDPDSSHPPVSTLARRIARTHTPRRFYLSRPASPLPANGEIKDASPKRKRPEAPIFEERMVPKKARTVENLDTSTIESYSSPDERIIKSRVSSGRKEQIRPSIKRPNITAAEKAFRQREWGHAKESAEQVEEPGAQQLSPSMQDLLHHVNAEKDKTASKYNPDAMDIDTDTSANSPYVYDIYIREVIPLEEKYMVPNYGLAIIEDDSYWDDWREDEEVEDEDDEDSNAEDGPNADYPEEMSDEDDEFDPYEYKDSDDFLDDEQEYLRDQGFHPAAADKDDEDGE
jgi:hypothetical protein